MKEQAEKPIKRRVLTEKTVEYPKKHWCLYFKVGDERRPFDGVVGRQERELENGMVELTIVDVLGYRERERARIMFGERITAHRDELRLGYIPREHMDELYARIKLIEPNPYVKTNRDVWLLETVAGYYKVIRAITENKGVLNARLIEKLFEDDERTKYCLSNDMLYYAGDNLMKERHAEKHAIEELTSIEVLKRFGLAVLEEVGEKTCAVVKNAKRPE